ncbi:DUF3540 domain-containing protein [Enterobacillus tribolii]|uniref:Uncharacterized protein DUF3540 n=1 Tax=Enterobacillus tribolii TaxID=1487935 RepID=A0A370Q6W0_9GAMM|nr:DUF3540 domain-containing protein [Enterobacillus tribolii]MBW7984903.1 DUF3540 domain-containing protein [Enterobacillus tribolii]RDK84115.1 uncharacterized protein DUF3540 [Enterobacillus tribolii]
MSNAIPSFALPVSPPQQAAGQVVNLFGDGSMIVECDGRGWHCQRAASCLMTPECGDRVLIASAGEQLWLLAVLERAESHQPATLSVEGDLRIAPTGDLSLSSGKLNVTAESGDCHIDAMNYSGKSLTAWLSLTRIVGGQFESVWQTVTQLSNRLLRRTQTIEQVRAGQLDMQAEDYLRAHAQNTFITAKGITKVDSEQIHMG